MKHEFNINNLGQRTARKIQQLPPPPFTMNIIHSKDRMYTSKGNKIVPYFPTNSRTIGNKDRGENKLVKHSTGSWNGLLSGRNNFYTDTVNNGITEYNPFKRGVAANWGKSKFGDGTRYFNTWESSHSQTSHPQVPIQNYGDSTNGNQNKNGHDVGKNLEGISIKRIIGIVFIFI